MSAQMKQRNSIHVLATNEVYALSADEPRKKDCCCKGIATLPAFLRGRAQCAQNEVIVSDKVAFLVRYCSAGAALFFAEAGSRQPVVCVAPR
jgi:hypothetical protein